MTTSHIMSRYGKWTVKLTSREAELRSCHPLILIALAIGLGSCSQKHPGYLNSCGWVRSWHFSNMPMQLQARLVQH
jgi:hypothetical protein